MTTFKEYARQAKQRLKDGFWDRARACCDSETAVTRASEIFDSIYNKESYDEEKRFMDKVRALRDEEGVTDPIMRLADKEVLESLSPEKRQAYLLKLSARWTQALEKLDGKH